MNKSERQKNLKGKRFIPEQRKSVERKSLTKSGKAVRDMLIAVEDCFKVSVNRSRHFVVFFFINSSVMLRKDTDDCSKLINGACCHVVFPVINEDNASSINMINDRVKCLIFHQCFSSQIFQYFFEVTDESPMLNTINTIPVICIRMIT